MANEKKHEICSGDNYSPIKRKTADQMAKTQKRLQRQWVKWCRGQRHGSRVGGFIKLDLTQLLRYLDYNDNFSKACLFNQQTCNKSFLEF